MMLVGPDSGDKKIRANKKQALKDLSPFVTGHFEDSTDSTESEWFPITRWFPSDIHSRPWMDARCGGGGLLFSAPKMGKQPGFWVVGTWEGESQN